MKKEGGKKKKKSYVKLINIWTRSNYLNCNVLNLDDEPNSTFFSTLEPNST